MEKSEKNNLITNPLILNTKQDKEEDEEDSKLNFHISVHYAFSFILISLFSDVKKLGFFPQDTNSNSNVPGLLKKIKSNAPF